MRSPWKLSMLYLLCLSNFLEFLGCEPRLFSGGFDLAYLRLAQVQPSNISVSITVAPKAMQTNVKPSTKYAMKSISLIYGRLSARALGESTLW